jgi:hypothetical protein
MLSAKPNSHRIESVGKHIYKTYYEHASTYLLYAIGQSESEVVYKERLAHTLAELEHYSTLGNDKQYADLLIDYSFVCVNDELEKARSVFLSSIDYNSPNKKFDGHINSINQQLVEVGYSFSSADKNRALDFLKRGKNITDESRLSALENYKLAFFYYPTSTKINFALLEAYFKVEDFQSAYQQAIYLANVGEVPTQKMLRILIHTSLEVNEYNASKSHCEKYINLFPDDKLIQEILFRLQSDDRKEELKNLFKYKVNRGNFILYS